MPITVQEIVNLPIFNTAKVKSGIEILDQRRVEWMSAIEGPVENFVRKFEFVLTTGLGCERDPTLLFEFTKDVYESGASALGIAIGRYVFDIPQEIIEFAEEKEFVIIELPWELRFTDLQREVMSEINKRQESFMERARHMQKELIDFVIQGKPLTEMIKYVERELNCSIVFIDKNGQIKSSKQNPQDVIANWESVQTNAEVMQDDIAYHHIKSAPFEDGYILNKEITTGTVHGTQGNFIVVLHDQQTLKTNTLQILDSLAAATALWVSREDAIVKTEIRLRNEFIWGLAKTPQMKLDENTESRGKLLGYHLELPYVCMVGYSDNFDSFYQKQSGFQEFGFKNIIYYIEEEVRYAASVVDKEFAFTFDNDKLIIYLQFTNEEYSTVHHFLDLLDKRLNKLIPGSIFSWGIGISRDGVMQFYESYQKANSALDIGCKQKLPGERISFDDTKLNRLLLHLANNQEIRDITLTTLAPLIEYEKKREMDLIDTFIAYDNQNGNVSQAARVLNLHRQSLLYRLRKIESLTNLSLDNPDDVFLLNISIKVWLTGMFDQATEMEP